MTSMIADLIGLHSLLLPINDNNYNSKKRKIATLSDNRKIYIKKLTKDA